MFKKNALLSVYHKEGITEFAQGLIDLGWKLYASGGTAKHLKAAGLKVTDVAELVGGGAILGHRVVTLSRQVHAGLQARDEPDDIAELKKLDIPWIDLVCIDLYPLEQETANPHATLESVIEQTDIGGPTMLRSAAKGKRIVIGDPADRATVLEKLRTEGDLLPIDRQMLAAKTEYIVARYCLASTRYLGNGFYDGMIGRQVAQCKYGENPYQKPAALYTTETDNPLALDKFKLVSGADPSFINYTDFDRLLQTITHIAGVFELNRD